MIPIRFVPPPDDVRRAIPFMALLAALSTLWARRVRRLRETRVSLQAKPGQIAGG